jgi:hypothetical protein
LDESCEPWQITVKIDSLRKQKVHVDFAQKDSSGQAVVGFWSVCGPAVERNAMSLLRYNTGLVNGAFSIRSVNGVEMVVLQANQMADLLDALAVTRIIAALAWQADKVEQKLTGGDEY